MSFQWSRSDVTVGDGFLRIAREQIGKAIAGAENDAETPEKRVHEARRRCKKLRALFRLVRPDFAAYARENAFVRDASRSLAAARDMHVTRDTYVELMAWAGRSITVPATDGGNSTPEGDTEALRHFAGRMRELDQRSLQWRLDRIDLDTLATGLERTYRSGRQTGREAEHRRTDEAFHDWRKYAKYHWNQLGLLESCAGEILPSAHRCAGDLAEQLGLHHDLAVLQDLLDTSPSDLGSDIDVAFALEAADRRRAEIEAKIATLGRQVFAETPKALKARFAAYLDDWTTRKAAE
jgi:CHAD domain-containing protein